jgi:hypothetical protein
MTGNKEKQSDRKQIIAKRELPSLTSTESSLNKLDKTENEEKERLEIPAFLRRQAN